MHGQECVVTRQDTNIVLPPVDQTAQVGSGGRAFERQNGGETLTQRLAGVPRESKAQETVVCVVLVDLGYVGGRAGHKFREPAATYGPVSDGLRMSRVMGFSHKAHIGWQWQKDETETKLVNMNAQLVDAFNYDVPSGFPPVVTLQPDNLVNYDLNADGTIDAGDAGLLFGEWTGDAAPSVPEPASAAILLVAFAMLARFRSDPTNRQ